MCLFCDIRDKKIPSTIVYENDYIYCINDIKPVSPVHVLIIPKKHFDDIIDMSSSEEGIKYIGEVTKAISEVAKLKSLEDGFRVINNCKENGGQTIMHAHFHLIGGTKLSERIL